MRHYLNHRATCSSHHSTSESQTMSTSKTIFLLSLFAISIASTQAFSGFYSNKAISLKYRPSKTIRPTTITPITTTTTQKPELDWIEKTNSDRRRICHALAMIFRGAHFCKKSVKTLPDLLIRFHPKRQN